jgi:hypothetical protein
MVDSQKNRAACLLHESNLIFALDGPELEPFLKAAARVLQPHCPV